MWNEEEQCYWPLDSEIVFQFIVNENGDIAVKGSNPNRLSDGDYVLSVKGVVDGWLSCVELKSNWKNYEFEGYNVYVNDELLYIQLKPSLMVSDGIISTDDTHWHISLIPSLKEKK